MKLTNICITLVAVLPLASAQRPQFRYPLNAIQEGTRLARGLTTYFNNFNGGLLSDVTISTQISTRLRTFNTFLSGELMRTLNENRFRPPTRTPVRPLEDERSCDNRKDITNAFAQFFLSAFDARRAIQRAICRTSTTINAAGANTVVSPVRSNARAQIDLVEPNIRRLYWLIDHPRTNPFHYFYFGCRRNDNPANCIEECPDDATTCPGVCPCRWRYINGVNPNAKNCPAWMSEARFDYLTSFSDPTDTEASGDRAASGWQNLKDCQECFPNGPIIPQGNCIVLPAVP